jgi:DNA-binding MarR family transcriptional regulator
MMDNKQLENKQMLNELLVNLFNYILLLEERNLKKHGLNNLSITEIHIIEAIAKVDAPSMSEVANRLMVTAGTLSTSVNRLIQKGFVESERSENDRRVVLLSLTQKGKEAFDIHEVFHDNMIRHILKNTKINEDELLLESLGKLMEFFKSLNI